MKARVVAAVLPYRRPVVIVVQLAMAVLSNLLAFELRFDGRPPGWAMHACWSTLPFLVAFRALAFFYFRLHEGLWRYSSVWDLRRIVRSVLASSAAFYLLSLTPFAPHVYPRSIFVVDALLLIAMLAGARLARRILREMSTAGRDERVLIYGAGDSGEMIVRDMKNNPVYEYEPVGFIDDDPQKTGRRIHGVPVLGTREDLADIIQLTAPHEILISMPRVDAATIRGIISSLEPFKLPIKTLPDLSHIIDGRVAVTQIRNLQTEDLLNRAPVGLDTKAIRRLIAGRRVMVTGAGGSIGSELCRQIATFGPACVVLLERYENSLFAIENDLLDRKLARGVIAEIGDVTDSRRMEQILSRYKPEIVFHAAAHKHVPLMEQSPCEAVKNNVGGTRLLAELADKHGVDRFIFISTDKAVNPTSVMGATKRVAELLVHAQAQGSGTSFFTVRFGNVLGSNGSVVPRFLDQIKTGGPVTVTHPEIQRFFMLIPEAVQLVLHAAAHGTAGATYVLEMGEQVKVVDMARNLIRLSGFVPDEEIPIQFVGLRPGEKLFEELIGEEEVVVPSAVEKVIQVQPRREPTPASLREAVGRLEHLAWQGRPDDVRRQLGTIVPEYSPMVPIGVAEPALTYTPAEIEPEADVEMIQFQTAQACPTCKGTRVYRSRIRSIGERVKKATTHDRLFRCHDCGWRGWLAIPVTMSAPVRSMADGDTAPVDLAALDSWLEREAVPVGTSGQAFSPRNLR